MNIKSIKKMQGVTLIELMIVVVILAVIVAFAYPSYQEQLRKAKRKDAVYALTDVANRMERFYSENNTYILANGLTDIGLGDPLNPTDPVTSPDGLYTLAVRGTVRAYTTAAVPVTGKSQASDPNCKTFTLTNTGVKTVTGNFSSDPIQCWK